MFSFIITLVLSYLFFTLYNKKSISSTSNNESYWKFEIERADGLAKLQQEMSDRQMDYKINSEVRKRINKYKKHQKFLEETKGMDGLAMYRHSLISENWSGIEICNTFEFSQIVYHIDSWKYVGVDIMKLIKDRVEKEKLL